MAKYDEFGREVPDPRPVEMPLHFKRPKTLNEIVGEELARQVRRMAESQEAESFEDADDFDVGDDDEMMLSPYEMTPEQEYSGLHSETLDVDNPPKKEDNSTTVDKDRIKENTDGGQSDGGSGRSGNVADGSGSVRKDVGAKSNK